MSLNPVNQLRNDTVAIDLDGPRVTIIITYATAGTARAVHQRICREAREEGVVYVDIGVVPRPVIDAEDRP